MPSLVVGTAEVPYSVRRSQRAKYYRIVVNPESVELVIPKRGTHRDALAFLHERQFWIYEKLQEVRALDRDLERGTRFPKRFVDGERIPFRGRWLTLNVREAKLRKARVLYNSALTVELPAGLSDEARERRARKAIEAWFDEKALADAWRWAHQYEPQLGTLPKTFLMRRQKTRWGSCAADGTIRLNRLLVAAPKRSFEYVVVHELCHLKIRNHSSRFWNLVGKLMPDYGEHKQWLAENGGRLD